MNAPIDESVVALLSLLSLVVGVALYVWTSLALGAMFRKMGEEAWKGWVPFLNVATVLRWGGFSPWLVLLALIPPLSIVVFVLVVISAHRINSGFGYGAGMTVLAALVFVVWASILGFGPARWLGARPAGWKPPEPAAAEEPAASAPRTPAPGSPFASLFPGADAGAAAADPAPAGGAGPVSESSASSPSPASAVPSASGASETPAALQDVDPLSAFAPPPVTSTPAWTPPDTTTTPPPHTAAAPAGAPPTAAAPAGDPPTAAAPEPATPVAAVPEPVPPAAAADPVSAVPLAAAGASEPGPAAPPTAAAQVPISAVPPAPAAASRPAPVPAADADGDQRVAASAAMPGAADGLADDDAKWPSEVDDVSAIAPSHFLPASAAGGRHVVPPVTADDAPIDVVPGRRSTAVPLPESATVTRVPAAQPSARAARAERIEPVEPVDSAADTVIERPAPAASAPPVTTEAPRAVRSAVDPDAEPPSRRARPWPAFAVAPGEPEDFPELSGEVSAVIGSPAAGSPRSALNAVSAQQRRLEPFADDDDLDQTVITRRAKKPTWQLVPASGAPVPLTSDVVILGRRPVGDAAFPGAQLVAVPGDARTVSKTHARLERRDEAWVVTDLGSTNGVLVRTLMGDEIEVEPGSQIDAGERFFLGDEEFHLKQIER
ncbi:DUF5684 domain-containing protein [Microbacterium aurum]